MRTWVFLLFEFIIKFSQFCDVVTLASILQEDLAKLGYSLKRVREESGKFS
jgi:hypothetical protein